MGVAKVIALTFTTVAVVAAVVVVYSTYSSSSTFASSSSPASSLRGKIPTAELNPEAYHSIQMQPLGHGSYNNVESALDYKMADSMTNSITNSVSFTQYKAHADRKGKCAYALEFETASAGKPFYSFISEEFSQRHTDAGCECKEDWDFADTIIHGCTTLYHDQEWCLTKSKCNGNTWGNCDPVARKTESGCNCIDNFIYKDVSYSGCIDNDHTQEWCMVDKDSCGKSWDNCVDVAGFFGHYQGVSSRTSHKDVVHLPSGTYDVVVYPGDSDGRINGNPVHHSKVVTCKGADDNEDKEAGGCPSFEDNDGWAKIVYGDTCKSTQAYVTCAGQKYGPIDFSPGSFLDLAAYKHLFPGRDGVTCTVEDASSNDDDNTNDDEDDGGATGSACTDTDRTQILKEHNSARKAVGTAALKWSSNLATDAQEWADHLKRNNGCNMQHASYNKRKPQGENLYWCWSSSGGCGTGKKATESWNDEKADYIYNTHGKDCKRGAVCGHYTQNVWHDTTEVGCGWASCGNSEIWVCRYNPGGNWLGKYAY